MAGVILFSIISFLVILYKNYNKDTEKKVSFKEIENTTPKLNEKGSITNEAVPNTQEKQTKTINTSLDDTTLANSENLIVLNYRNDDHKYGLVVYDEELQPEEGWCWLYYIYGQQLVCSPIHSKSKLHPVSNIEHINFAKRQYQTWQSINENTILMKMESKPSEEASPPPKCKCSACKGDSVVYWSTGSTAAYQGSSDRQNYRDICRACRGAGFVENIL